MYKTIKRKEKEARQKLWLGGAVIGFMLGGAVGYILALEAIYKIIVK